MALIGYSTGTLAKEKYREGIQMLSKESVRTIELSALRERELDALIGDLNSLPLSQFDHIALHAPSELVHMTEQQLVDKLMPLKTRGWPIIVHPDIISNYSLWRPFGELLHIENMDIRKKMGRTAKELHMIFEHLPNASLCFDIAHAAQVDRTMCEARKILTSFHGRIRQLHFSQVNSLSKHEPFTLETLLMVRRIKPFLPIDAPVILEAPPAPGKTIADTIQTARRILLDDAV